MDLTSIISKLGLPVAMTQDVTLFLAVVFLSFVFGMFIGRFRIVTILINAYIALALLKAVPVQYISSYSHQLTFFFACLIVFTLFGKSLFEIPISGAGSGYFWRILILSFLEIILILSVIFSILPKKEALAYISPSAYEYLVSSNFHFIWLILPLIFVFIIHKKLNR